MAADPSRFANTSATGWENYITAVVAVGLAIGLKAALEPYLGAHAPFLLFFGAVMVSAAVGGFLPGIVATALSALAAALLFLAPSAGARVVPRGDLVLLTIFCLEGCAISMVGGALHGSAERGEQARRDAVAEEARAREETQIVETLHSTGLAIASERDLAKLVQAVTDATTSLSGAEFGAFFYNVTRPDGDAYTLYTISGAPRERFARFPLPRSTQIFAPTFNGEAVVRLDDVTLDPRYGQNAPYTGMPPGHLPVRSYLAVPVGARTGEVLGALFFGHSAAGRFTERHERLVVGIAAYAAVAMENATLYTKLEDAVREEKAARGKLEIANRTKDEFLATVSHELRTPLTPILAWARILRTRTLDADGTGRAIETIERAARSQAQLVDDLLDVSRIISGKIHLDVRRMDLRPVIEMAIESLRPAAEAKGMALEVALDGRAGLVSADPERIQQVVWNLLSNAIKFTPRDGRVRIGLARVGSHVEVTITDTGLGIAAEFLPRVFERFQQADASTTRLHGGLGLGLAIVRHMVELHGGTVSCESAGVGTGTTFTVGLPLASAQTAVAEARPETGLRGAFAVDQRLAGRKVLVVDDERDTLETICAVLEMFGAETRGAGSTREALDVLAGWRPDVLVSDIGMAGEDGYGLIRRVRALDPVAGGRTPALALTAYARVEDRLKVLAAGFQMHVAKPVDPSELIATVTSLAIWGRPASET